MIVHSLSRQVVKQAVRGGVPGAKAATADLDVRVALARLAKQWPAVESLLLGAGRVDDAIQTYRDAHKWSDAVRVAETCR